MKICVGKKLKHPNEKFNNIYKRLLGDRNIPKIQSCRMINAILRRSGAFK